ncbi:hypothetical protein ASU31_21735 [Pedobacter ginsenosidimutans]|uniref:TANFOR domain-containing protein n=1 Tax=Pedobacter ginsenosidimutans TaxID=687842 RepID=A0A0T5VJH9_9SPHI|nr:hypothetical protein [Pedobacter ginsenosidimutans]KRT14035.1 hypothetical protein ASU31_21735 [Pedobacter ginsenosidimutans]
MTKFYPIIKRFKRSAALLLMAILTMVSDGLFAQAQVNINVTVAPPYSPFYSDYAGTNASKVLLIVQNLTSTQKKIKLTGQLSGDNGIKISTKSTYVPLQPIILNPNETKQLNGLALKDIFDLNTLNVYGIDKVKLVRTSRLPEGNYTFCIQAVDMTTNQVISTGAPLGCSFISIIYPDAPVLTNPFANSSIPALTGQSFVWLNNLPLSITVMYQFQVAEMPDERKDPNQILNATSRLKIDRTIVNSTSTILLPSDPPLTEGKRYAWRVIASDPSGKIIFKNNGISGANEFRYGEKPYITSTFLLNTPKENIAIKNLDDLVFDWTFTDNSSKNDKIGFYDGPIAMNNSSTSLQSGAGAWGSSTAKYQLHITRVKTAEEIKAEQRAAMVKAPGSSSIPKDNGITIGVNKETIDFKSTPAIAAYVKDGNNYTWQVKHVATSTLSETRPFTVKYEKIIKDYTVALSGTLQYNFYDNYVTGFNKIKQDKELKFKLETQLLNVKTRTEQAKIQAQMDKAVVLTELEKGFPLANKNVQVLKVQLLAPTFKVTKTVKVMENGVEKIYSEEQDSIASVSDLLTYPYGAPKIPSATIIATGKTDGMGNFKIDVPIDQTQFKVSDPINISGKSYAFVEGLVVKIEDNRLSDPNWFVVPNSNNKSITLNENIVEAYSYKVNTKLTTTAQRNYKGKLYLLRKAENVFNGEVENIIGQNKDIPIYKSTNTLGIDIIKKSTQSYVVVGNTDIDGLNTGNFNTSFSNLVSAANANDSYTVFFEPSNELDALYFSPQTVSKIGGKTNAFEATDFLNKNITETVSFGPKFISMNVSGRYVYNWKQPYGKTNISLPLPEGTELKLLKGNLSQKDFFKGGTILLDERIIATTTVKKNGEYTFKVGMQDYNTFNDGKTYNLVILVQSNQYYSQPYAIPYNQNEDIKLPELTATVQQYSFKSKLAVNNGPGGTPPITPVAGMDVYLCRKIGEDIPLGRPVNDGDPNKATYFKKIWERKNEKNQTEKYEIIDKTTSFGSAGKEGYFAFDRLVTPADINDKYYIFAEPISTSQDNFITQDAFSVTSVLNFEAQKQGHFTDEQTILTQDYNIGYLHVPVVPLAPYIDGAVYPSSNASTSVLSGVHVELFNMSGLANTATDSQIEAYLKATKPQQDFITGTNGRFLFENINSWFMSSWKLLRLTKNGFLVTYKKLNSGKPLVKGQRENLGKVYMDLPIMLTTTVVDDKENTVAARIIVGDDFSWSDYKPETGYPTTLQSPKGKVAFTIIPVDRANYKTTVVTLDNVIANQTVKFKVKKNTRNITVYCYKKGTKITLESTVTVLNTGNYLQTKGAFLGKNYNYVEIAAGGSQFDLKIVPTDKNYTIAKTQVHVDGLTDVIVSVEVEPAVSITVNAQEVFGNWEIKPLNGEYNTYVEGMDEDEYVKTSKKVTIVTNSAKEEIKVVPKTDKVPKKIKFGALKKASTTEMASASPKNNNYYSAVQQNDDDLAKDMVSPDGATLKINGYDDNSITENEIAIPENEATFSAETYYTITLSRLPANRSFTIIGTKADYIGGTQPINPSGANANVMLNFVKAPNMNVNSMYGFPIELTKAQYVTNTQYKISGKLTPTGNVSESTLKRKYVDRKLEFTDILVNVNQAPSGQEKDRFFTLANGMVFNQNDLEAVLFSKYDIKILDKGGLALYPQTATTASIFGKVGLDAASLAKGVETSSSDNVGDNNYLYLNNANASYALITALPADKKTNNLYTFSTGNSDLTSSQFLVSSNTRAKPKFIGADDIVVTPDANVMLTNTGISFLGTLTTDLAYTTNRDIQAKAKFTLNENGFKSENQQKITIKLNQWQLDAPTWTFGSEGLTLKGNLSALGLTFPFSNLKITRNKIGFGDFEVNSLKLLNAFPITIKGSDVYTSFGYDKGYSKDKGAWSVSLLTKSGITSLASLKGLPDLEPTDEIKINNINLYDTGNENDTRILLSDKQPAVTLNGIAKYKPSSVWGGSDFVTFRGDLNMDIPGFTGLDLVTYDLTYKAENGKLAHKHDVKFQNLGLDTKGIKVTFDGDQRFTNGELYLKGYLKDKDIAGKYKIDVELTKTKNETKLVVPKDTKIYLNDDEKSGSYLDKATGQSKVVSSEWEYFTFGGDMTGASGITPSPMSFTIKGDIIANSSALGVNNMDAGGVKGLSIVYDFNQKALIGSGHLNQSTNFASLDLDAELKLGSSDWYIFSNGLADVKYTPFTGIGVGFMVGNATLSESQKNSFYKHFGGTDLPDATKTAFADVKGVLLVVSAEMPIPLLPSFDLDLNPVAHCSFTHGLYAAAYLKANFSLKPEDIAISVGGRVGAFVKLSAGASVGLACAGISLGADAHADINGYLAPLKGEFSATMGLTFTLQGSAYVGAGVCNSSCETPCVSIGFTDICSPIPCVRVGLNKTLVLGVEAGVNNKGIFISNQSKTYQ